MHAVLEFDIDFSKLGSPSLAHRFAKDRKHSLPGLAATMSESQEVERLRLSFATAVSVFPRKPAKLQNAGFVRMEF
jgi:hypothetical protein